MYCARRFVVLRYGFASSSMAHGGTCQNTIFPFPCLTMRNASFPSFASFVNASKSIAPCHDQSAFESPFSTPGGSFMRDAKHPFVCAISSGTGLHSATSFAVKPRQRTLAPFATRSRKFFGFSAPDAAT